MAHVYIGIEDIGLTIAQRATLWGWLQTLGPLSDPQPARLFHWRVRLDQKAAICEALFAEDTVTIQAIKNRLAAIFDIDPATISHTVTQTQYGPLVTFSRNGDKLRLVQFGGVDPTWTESGDACRLYLVANAAEWEETP